MNDQECNEDPMAQAKAGVKETVRETKDKIKAKTREVAAQARERSEDYVRQGKERAADRLVGVSETIRQTADRFERDQDTNIAHYTRALADRLQGAANYVRERDLNQLREDTEDLARRHPTAFFGSMFVVGLAAARFLKASADRDHTPRGGGAARDESATRFAGTEEEMAAESVSYPAAGASAYPSGQPSTYPSTGYSSQANPGPNPSQPQGEKGGQSCQPTSQY